VATAAEEEEEDEEKDGYEKNSSELTNHIGCDIHNMDARHFMHIIILKRYFNERMDILFFLFKKQTSYSYYFAFFEEEEDGHI